MSEGVVDLPEIVEVEQQDRHASPLGERLLDLLTEHQPVGEIGQAIVQGLVLQGLLPLSLAPPQLCLLERVIDGSAEPPQPVFEDIVHGAQPHSSDRHVFADGARDKHERDLQPGRVHQLQSP